MNYYERHIGDYIRDTSHLSLLEHGVYARLLDVYYLREEPIPKDQAQRLVGARSIEERAAVDSVLAEFFVLTDEGWRQKRCDEQIETFRAFMRSQSEKGKAGAAKRWGSPNVSSGHATAIAPATKVDSSGHATATSGQWPNDSLPLPTSHFPLPTSHSVLRTEEEQNSTETASVSGPSATPPADDGPKAKRKSKPEDRGTRIPDPFVLTADMRAWATAEVPGIDAVAATREFVDYWRDVPGQRGRKVSWVGTWKNRMREVYAKRRPLNGHTPKPSSVDADGIPTWATAEERAELLRLREQETARADH